MRVSIEFTLFSAQYRPARPLYQNHIKQCAQSALAQCSRNRRALCVGSLCQQSMLQFRGGKEIEYKSVRDVWHATLCRVCIADHLLHCPAYRADELYGDRSEGSIFQVQSMLKQPVWSSIRRHGKPSTTIRYIAVVRLPKSVHTVRPHCSSTRLLHCVRLECVLLKNGAL